MDIEAMHIAPCNVHVNSGSRAKEPLQRFGKSREWRMHFVYVAENQCCAFTKLMREFFDLDPGNDPTLARAVVCIRTWIDRGTGLYQFELIRSQCVQFQNTVQVLPS